MDAGDSRLYHLDAERRGSDSLVLPILRRDRCARFAQDAPNLMHLRGDLLIREE